MFIGERKKKQLPFSETDLEKSANNQHSKFIKGMKKEKKRRKKECHITAPLPNTQTKAFLASRRLCVRRVIYAARKNEFTFCMIGELKRLR